MRIVKEISGDGLHYEKVVNSLKGKTINFYPMMLPVSGKDLKDILKKEFPNYSFDELEFDTIAMCGISISPCKDPDY